MNDETQNNGQPPRAEPPAQEERAIQESAWQVAQQVAQMFGEVGGGVAGLATAANIGSKMLAGRKPSEPPAPTNDEETDGGH